MTSPFSFSVQDGILCISGDDPDVGWKGQPDGMPVLDLRMAPDGRSAFVLLDPPAGGGRVRNLVRLTSSGFIAWRGELPQADCTDAYVSFETDTNGFVLAATWSGYRVRIDPDTGRLLGGVFTK